MEIDIDLSMLIAAASAIAALLSAMYAASSAQSAKKSLALMNKDRGDKEKGLHAYLIDAAVLASPEKKRVIAMAFTLTNLASVPNSISAAELHVYEYQTSGVPLRLTLRATHHDASSPWTLERLPMPINLESRSSASGWLAFTLPEAFGTERAIDKCVLLFSSAVGEQASVETHLLKEIEFVQEAN